MKESIFFDSLPRSWQYFDQTSPDINQKEVPEDFINDPSGTKVVAGQLERMLRLPGVEAVKLKERIEGLDTLNDFSNLTDEDAIDKWLTSLEWNWYSRTPTLTQKLQAIGFVAELNQRRGRFDSFRFVVFFLLGWEMEIRRYYERVFIANDPDISIFDTDNTTANGAIGTTSEEYHYFLDVNKYNAGLLRIIIDTKTDDQSTIDAKREDFNKILVDWLPFGMNFRVEYVADLTVLEDNFDDLSNWAIHDGEFNAVANELTFDY